MSVKWRSHCHSIPLPGLGTINIILHQLAQLHALAQSAFGLESIPPKATMLV